MLKSIYIHNFKCFQDFKMDFDEELSTSLFLGKNGAGKSALVQFLNVFRHIGDGRSQLGDLVDRRDFNINDPFSPMILKIEVVIDKFTISYELSLDFPENFDNARVITENLIINDMYIIKRINGSIEYQEFPIATPTKKSNQKSTISRSSFFSDWHIIALNIINTRQTQQSPFVKFKDWLSKIVILSPVPTQMTGESHKPELKPNFYTTNIGNWATGLLRAYPSSYVTILRNLKRVFEDIEEVRNPPTSATTNKLSFIFVGNDDKVEINFDQLSNGEKIFIVGALLSASVELGLISLCVWDEPDNYISLVEIATFFVKLKRVFYKKTQLITMSHSPEIINSVGTENIFILYRNNHIDFTKVRNFVVNKELSKYDNSYLIKNSLVEL